MLPIGAVVGITCKLQSPAHSLLPAPHTPTLSHSRVSQHTDSPPWNPCPKSPTKRASRVPEIKRSWTQLVRTRVSWAPGSSLLHFRPLIFVYFDRCHSSLPFVTPLARESLRTSRDYSIIPSSATFMLGRFIGCDAESKRLPHLLDQLLFDWS